MSIFRLTAWSFHYQHTSAHLRLRFQAVQLTLQLLQILTLTGHRRTLSKMTANFGPRAASAQQGIQLHFFIGQRPSHEI